MMDMKKVCTMMLAAALALTGAAQAEVLFEFSAGSAVTGSSAQGAENAVAADWNYPISREILADPDGVLVLANKDHLLEKSYPDPSTLVTATVRKASSSKMQARDVAYAALEKMFTEAEAQGIRLYLKSAYRSYRTQEVMHYNRVQSMGYDDGMVQAAGASDHQTGMGFDIVSKSWTDRKMNRDFAKTEEGQWMAAHCAEYGFIIRYLDGKEDVTGIYYEPWHLRYVGVEVATYMMANNLTLEEFTEEYQRALAAYESGESWDAPLEPEPVPTFGDETDAFTF